MRISLTKRDNDPDFWYVEEDGEVYFHSRSFHIVLKEFLELIEIREAESQSE